ncbi:hypothetical protein C8R45DRAFT_1135352 [Mycena sanguinolenta]|nr:hypothetical protein C8R45DRAFT_1135352 [Mycena sanguinolenta]
MAGQHLKPAVPFTAAQPAPAPSAQPGTAPSATHSSIFGSRTYTPSATAAAGGTTGNLSGHFRDAVQQWEKLMEAQRPHPLNSTGNKPFDPAGRAYAEADLNPLNSKSNKRKRPDKSTSDRKPSTRRSPQVSGVRYDVVLVKGTKLVARDQYRRPDAEKLVRLGEHSLIQKITLSHDATALEIQQAVRANFSHIPALVLHGFRVLNVKKATYTTKRGRRSTRVEFRLRPSKVALKMESWARAATMAIPHGSKDFKNVVYIALNPAGPNLKFPGSDISARFPTSDQESRTSETDTSDSDESMESAGEESRNAETESRGGGSRSRQTSSGGQKGASDSDSDPPFPPFSKGKEPEREHSPQSKSTHAKDEDSDLDTPFEGFTPNDREEDSSSWHPYPSAHRKLVRLLRNMSKPENLKDAPWWKTTTMHHLASFNDVLPLIAEIFELAENAQISVDVCFEKLKKHIITPLDQVRTLAISISMGAIDGVDDFPDLVAVRPGGISTVLPVFDAVYRGLEQLRSSRSYSGNAAAIAIKLEIMHTSDSLLTCLRYLRSQLLHGVFDPKGGFRELATLLDSPSAARILPHGQLDSRMISAVKLIDLELDSPFSITTSLATAFGDAVEPKKILIDVVTQGEFGLKYFYLHVVAPFLDDVEREDWDEIYIILIKSCFALSRKVSNYLKTSVGTGARAPSPAGNPGEGSSNSGPGPNTRRRRNAKSGHFKSTAHPDPDMDEYFPYWRELASDTDDDLTNTDSMDGDEWWKAPKEGPDIKTRRNRRHPHIISSDSDSKPNPHKPRGNPPPRQSNRKPPPKSKPKTKPAYVEVNSSDESLPDLAPPQPAETREMKDIREATALADLSWTDLQSEILTRFPHPDPKIRMAAFGPEVAKKTSMEAPPPSLSSRQEYAGKSTLAAGDCPDLESFECEPPFLII